MISSAQVVSSDDECPSLEELIRNVRKVISVNEALKKAMEDFCEFHSGYALNELRLAHGYGVLCFSLHEDKARLEKFLKRQGGENSES